MNDGARPSAGYGRTHRPRQDGPGSRLDRRGHRSTAGRESSAGSPSTWASRRSIWVSITSRSIDVPGHERFIRNMLAGASGLDLAMLIVAADDSVMPQTREHLEILRLLGLWREGWSS